MLHFDYNICGHGWASVMIADEAGTHVNRVTHVAPNDPLQETLEACIRLAGGSERCGVSYFDEPGEHRFHFVRKGPDVETSVVWWPDDTPWSSPVQKWVREDLGWHDISHESPWPKSAAVFWGIIPFEFLCRDILAATTRIFETLGVDGYERTWNGRFPTEEFTRLSGLLGSAKMNPSLRSQP
jgi:hypothetical protein